MIALHIAAYIALGSAFVLVLMLLAFSISLVCDAINSGEYFAAAVLSFLMLLLTSIFAAGVIAKII